MFDLERIKGAALEAILRQMPAAAVIAEAPSGKLVLINERARRILKQNSGWSGLPEPEDIWDFGYLRMFHSDGRLVEMEEWPLVRSIASGEEVRDEEHSYLLTDGSHLTIRSDSSPIYDDEGHVVAGVLIVRDVTKRKQIEEECQRLAKIARNSSDFIGIADMEWRAVFLNEAGQRMVGLHGIEEVRQTEVADYFMPEDREFLQRVLVEKVMGEGRWAGELRLRHFETGEPIPVSWDGFRVDDPRTGEPIGVATVIRDITERKRAEEELRESEGHMRFVLKAGGLGAWKINLEPLMLETSETCKHNFGLSPEDDFPIERFLAMIHPGDLDQVRSTMETAISTQTDYRPDDYRIITPGGEMRWISARGRMVYTPDGEPSHLAGVTLDVTRRKRDEEEIRTRARQQQAIAELGQRALANDGLQSLMDEAVALVARTLGVELCKVVELLTGGEEVLLRSGVGWKDGLVGTATARVEDDPQVEYTLRSEEPVIVEDLAAETRFGPSPLLLEYGVVSGMTVVIGGREGPFGGMGAHTKNRRSFTHDDANFLQAVANVLAVAVEREAMEERLSKVREAERSRIARDLHDEAFRDLTYALAEAQHIQSISNDPQQARKLGQLVAALKRTGQHLRAAIYDLRLGEDQDKPFPELLELLVELHRTMAPDYDICLELGDGVLSGPLGETGTELLHVLGEALTNARRHSEAHSVRVAVGTSEEKLWAEVLDDGCGFDPTREPSVTGDVGGTGIKGMRERARSLGGNLEIQSEPGRGTKVRFEMLLRGKPKLPEEAVRVLLVEDHASVRESIASSFEREAGFTVVGQAGSLAEARRLIEGEPVDVTVVDLGLPDGYGGDLIRDLREANPQTQTLVLSANFDRAEMARAVESGAAGILNKAVHLNEVVEAIRRLRAGETLLSMEEVVELLRFAGSQREQEYETRRQVDSLTVREKEVLQALAEGLGSKEIAERLHISLRTERNHVANILSKLEVHSQLQALVFALRHGVIEIRE